MTLMLLCVLGTWICDSIPRRVCRHLRLQLQFLLSFLFWIGWFEYGVGSACFVMIVRNWEIFDCDLLINFKSICFCQQLSGVFDPTLGYIILSFLAGVAVIGSFESIVGCLQIDPDLEVVTQLIAFDCCQWSWDPKWNHRNSMDLCRHSC